ncbi:MAG: hypothetical protein LQ343_000862 [Gyalolechia ehrenbergii]|nr:MAG: hypothetical protein LQ343_000862 [Gyalolechia ehrenbergii]
MTERPSKRRHQTDITTYFNSTLATTAPHDENLSSTLSPAIPASIQSSLLNVGMRIRKSVPEGYKTKRCDFMPLRSKTSGVRHGSGTGYAELVPFCGMVKTGGYEVQSSHQSPQQRVPSSGTWFECGDDDDDEGGTLASSQESVREDGAAALGGRVALQAGKRRFIDEEEECEEENAAYADRDTNTSLSPMIAPRPMSQARNRRAGAATKKSPCEGDFEEATFLRSLDECMDFYDY